VEEGLTRVLLGVSVKRAGNGGGKQGLGTKKKEMGVPKENWNELSARPTCGTNPQGESENYWKTGIRHLLSQRGVVKKV